MHTMIAFWLTSRDEMQLIYSQFVLLTRYHYDERIQLTARWGLASLCKIVFCQKSLAVPETCRIFAAALRLCVAGKDNCLTL